MHAIYDSDSEHNALNSIMEFWTKITPGILQLLSQNKVVSKLLATFLLLKLIKVIHFVNESSF